MAPVLAAANKALIAESRGKLTTKTLHSECVFNLSGSKHISQSLSKWGVSDTATSVLVACFDATPAQVGTARKESSGSGSLFLYSRE